MQTWELAARIGAAYLIFGLSLASAWAFWQSTGATEVLDSKWKKLAVFGVLVLAAPLLLAVFAVLALWTWDLWEPLQRAREMDAKEGVNSADP